MSFLIGNLFIVLYTYRRSSMYRNPQREEAAKLAARHAIKHLGLKHMKAPSIAIVLGTGWGMQFISIMNAPSPLRSFRDSNTYEK